MKINMLALMAMLGLVFAAPTIAKAEDAPAAHEDSKSKEGHGPDGPRDGHRGGKHGKMFEESDKDGDGFLTKDEMLESHKKRVESMFETLDTDKNNKLSKEELAKGRDKMKAKWKEKREEKEAD